LIEVPITEGMYLGLDKIIIGNLLNVVQKGVYPKQRLLLQKYLRKSDLKSEMKGDLRGNTQIVA
jgi:hypothetical protein